MSSIIIEQNIGKTFRNFRGKKFHALEKVNLEIEEGEFFVLLGPSGCGKSTLLRIMSGLDSSFIGSQTYKAGVDKKDFSFVFQQFALLPWLTVEENAGLGLFADHTLTAEDKKTVSGLLKTLGLEGFSHQYPRELSGGMKQRVGIARALAVKPKVMFLDEPFSALDSFTATALRKELLVLWNEYKMTVVMVTHNIEEAVQLADRIAVMTSRPGTIDAILQNTLPRPRDPRSPEFFAMVDKLTALVTK